MNLLLIIELSVIGFASGFVALYCMCSVDMNSVASAAGASMSKPVPSASLSSSASASVPFNVGPLDQKNSSHGEPQHNTTTNNSQVS